MRLLLLLAAASLVAGCSKLEPVWIDLSTFPDSGEAVPDYTVLDDQWQSLGVLFDASPDEVDPVAVYWGDPHLFFEPDTEGAVAIIDFVDPDSGEARAVSRFTLWPYFNPGESAELVGLDASGAEVVTQAITAEDVGDESVSLEQTIEGAFVTAQWRTHGNPGIAANWLEYQL